MSDWRSVSSGPPEGWASVLMPNDVARELRSAVRDRDTALRFAARSRDDPRRERWYLEGASVQERRIADLVARVFPPRSRKRRWTVANGGQCA